MYSIWRLNVKIICLGLPRTGTISLYKAFLDLGYKTLHYPHSIEEIDKCEACTEVRYSYDEIRQRYPNAKIILTIRKDREKWLKSCERYVINYQPDWNPFWTKKDLWLTFYEKHLELSKKVEPNFLVLDICNKEGWDKLCPFLNVGKPDFNFPHLNKTTKKIF